MTVSGGYCRRNARASLRLAVIVLLACAAPAWARGPAVSIPATNLGDALTQLAQQTGADIISTEPGLRRVRVPALSGALTLRRALDRLLRDSGYRAVAIDARSYRIVRAAPPVHIARVRPTPPASTAEPDAAPADAEVVVTASKQRVPLLRYPGSLTTITANRWPLTVPAADMTDVARATPVLQTTELGPGRNKVFVRGIADSSFNGSTQSTASIYLGEAQIAYSEQDPDLKLYDIQSVQVLEGPQGTLYGSGAIGGIIRLIPNPVELSRFGGSAAGGVSLTRSGAPSYDLSAMLNVPVISDRLGVRIVGYGEQAGGYIDDPGRGLKDVNRTRTIGGRAAARYTPGGGWAIDFTGAWQRIGARDAPYAQLSVGDLARRSLIGQPFHSEVGLVSATVTKQWDSGLELLSVTGLATYHSSDRFDASAAAAPGMPPVPMLYETDGSKLLLTHETRLSRSVSGGGSWVAGVTLLRDRDAQNRSLGPPDAEADIIGVTNVTNNASLFAEGTWPVTRRLSGTLGGRYTLARTDGEPSFSPRGGAFVQGRSTRRFDPTAAVSWELGPRFALFARYQSGYRTGGLAVARGVGRVADFTSDAIRVGEIGLRRLHDGATGISFSSSFSFARWTDIQADLLNRRGQPYTINLGDAEIAATEGNVDWTPLRGLHASGSFLFTFNHITGDLAQSSSASHRRLPETPPLAATGDLSYEWPKGRFGAFSLGGSATYIGRSVLGAGDFLDISQGDYTVLNARAGLRRGPVEYTLTAQNLTNTRATAFAFGNPFGLAARDLSTPLRPFTLRLGAAIAW